MKKFRKKIVSMLMQDALTNIKNLSHQKALTGPLQRGDVETIKNHIASLRHHSKIKALYKILGELTLELTEHSDKKITEFKDILNGHKFDIIHPIPSNERGIG